MRIQPREPNAAERAVLQELLADDADDIARLRRQVPTLKVVGRCDCGCPSVDFDTSRASAAARDHLVRLEGRTEAGPDQPPMDVLLWERDGLPS